MMIGDNCWFTVRTQESLHFLANWGASRMSWKITKSLLPHFESQNTLKLISKIQHFGIINRDSSQSKLLYIFEKFSIPQRVLVGAEHTSMWMPEVSLRSIPPSLSTLFSEAGSFTLLHTCRFGVTSLPWVVCLYLQVLRLQTGYPTCPTFM